MNLDQMLCRCRHKRSHKSCGRPGEVRGGHGLREELEKSRNVGQLRFSWAPWGAHYIGRGVVSAEGAAIGPGFPYSPWTRVRLRSCDPLVASRYVVPVPAAAAGGLSGGRQSRCLHVIPVVPRSFLPSQSCSHRRLPRWVCTAVDGSSKSVPPLLLYLRRVPGFL